jgi:hypothetical protein
MRVLICGNRLWTDEIFINTHLKILNELYGFSILLSGQSRGVDAIAQIWAKNNNIPIELYPAKWEFFGRKAGFLRNHRMTKNADILIAFCDTNHNADAEMIIKMMRKLQKPCIVHYKR